MLEERGRGAEMWWRKNLISERVMCIRRVWVILYISIENISLRMIEWYIVRTFEIISQEM